MINNNTQLFELDLRTVQQQLRTKAMIRSADILGEVGDFFPVRTHAYHRIDEHTFLHPMDFRAAQAYSLAITRKDMLCIQIMLAGDYIRQTRDQLTQVDSSHVHVTNVPRSISDTEKGAKLRGALIAIDRQHFVDRFEIKTAAIPANYRPLLNSPDGLAQALQLRATADVMLPTDQILTAKFEEPLLGIFLTAKVEEILCAVAAQITLLSSCGPASCAKPDRLSEAVAFAASIYRRELTNPPSIDQLATRVGLNRNHLTMGFKKAFGLTPHAYVTGLRMDLAKHLLRENVMTASEVARRVGYEGFASLSRAYRDHFGYPPSQERLK
jgi:AraC family transcriptional regulator, transcriptional activator of the genes for pyochelin and ferripyochelin receptors